jgi:WhiB family transcriptional regulator, redox-sensing transcriptional regulator
MSDIHRHRHLPGRLARNGRTNWRDEAACRSTDPELFFPVGNGSPALRQIGRAKQVCARCPVRTPCLEWALETGQQAGVWGGTSEDERRVLRSLLGTLRADPRSRAEFLRLGRRTALSTKRLADGGPGRSMT